MASMDWLPFNNGTSIGQTGSESGIIIRDDEHHDGARITLERDGQVAPYSVTCGIYGWMVHTRFLGSEVEAQYEFECMRSELTKIIGMIPLNNDPDVDSMGYSVTEAIAGFVEKFR
jgi:hypothetical protein